MFLKLAFILSPYRKDILSLFIRVTLTKKNVSELQIVTYCCVESLT